MTPIQPSIEGIVDSFSISPSLPQGLVLFQNGTIAGKAIVAAPVRMYQVTATNGAGSVSTTLLITVYNRYCEMTSICPM